ncbi:MAG: leucine-rich repeat domain-containing protein [Paludibacteraceae bacterium]|nr:leucine-rich repeat domain-containing protein [Paludibacteraceae bacterium]
MKTINSFRSKLLALTLVLMASVSSFAYEFEYVNDFHIDGFAYKILPSNTMYPYGAVALVEIADCTKDVVIPEFVSNGNSEFRIETFGIGSVVFTNEASSIVESITIPKTIKIINKNVLAGCPNLKTVIVDSENPYYDSRESCNAIITTSQNRYFTPNTLIAGCKATTIPNSVVEIGENAFYNCQSLETITIPNSITKIGISAFNACTALSAITLSENLTAIGEWAFDDCNNLIEVVCYATQPPTISRYTFLGISPTIYVPVESIELYRKTNIWKDFQIMRIAWSEECYEYRDYNLTIQLFPRKSSLVYLLYNTIDRTIEPPYVDSVWILDPELDKQNPLHVHTSYAQPGDTIDLSFLEKNKPYILKVYINECQMSRVFLHRVVKWEYKWCNQWNVLWFDGTRFEETAKTSHYQLGQDTVIGDYTYRKFTSRTSVRFTEDWKVYVYYEGFDDNDPYTEDLPTGEYLAYDFSAQVGDTLEVFSGIGTYSTYLCVVDDVQQTDIQTTLRTITLHKICRMDTDGDGIEEDYDDREMTWIEGVGSPEGFLISDLPCGWVGGGTNHLLCAYKDDELKYTGTLYDEYGCEYNAGQEMEDLFPILWGLQRTSFTEYFDSGHQPESAPYLLKAGDTKWIDGKLYLDFGQYLREENGKIYIYSELLQKDFVLYDFTLELGDTLTTLNWDYYNPNSDGSPSVVDYDVDDCQIDTLIVTGISTITLLDGKKYKKWIFNHGHFGYVESIGTLSGSFYEISEYCMAVPGCYMGNHLVCASRNGQLIYQMDDAEMERLGAECLCDYDRGPRKDNAKDGQIGGRPTPTQWNQLELDLREMDNGTTILRAETFSYTLENDSIVANDKTFYQLARQSTKDTATTKSFVGALHFGKDEDNRVYFLRDGVEYVLYDFTAEPGDTVEIFAGINNYPQDSTYTHVVVDKDTTEDGACRMFLEVVFPEDTTTATNAEKVWLAGLGSVDGIVHNAATRTSNAHAAPARSAHSSDTQTSVMLCAWREDSCLYTTDHPDYDTLGCVYNIDELTAIEDTHSPSPTTDYQKLLRDGQLLIIHKGKTYNVLGVQVK